MATNPLEYPQKQFNNSEVEKRPVEVPKVGKVEKKQEAFDTKKFLASYDLFISTAEQSTEAEIQKMAAQMAEKIRKSTTMSADAIRALEESLEEIQARNEISGQDEKRNRKENFVKAVISKLAH